MTKGSRAIASCAAGLICLLSIGVQGQVTSQRLVNASTEPQNWLTYSGSYWSQRYSLLDQITPANVKNLKLQWVYQAPVAGNWQTTPIVADGVMYITQRPNDVLALDPVTGRVFWIYRYNPNPDRIVCCGANNRGVAIEGDTLFMGAVGRHVIAIDAPHLYARPGNPYLGADGRDFPDNWRRFAALSYAARQSAALDEALARLEPLLPA